MTLPAFEWQAFDGTLPGTPRAASAPLHIGPARWLLVAPQDSWLAELDAAQQALELGQGHRGRNRGVDVPARAERGHGEGTVRPALREDGDGVGVRGQELLERRERLVHVRVLQERLAALRELLRDVHLLHQRVVLEQGDEGQAEPACAQDADSHAHGPEHGAFRANGQAARVPWQAPTGLVV